MEIVSIKIQNIMKLNDTEWIELIRKTLEYMHADLRVGQSYMNALHDVRPDLYEEILNTDNDPFYIDDNIQNFINKIRRDENKNDNNIHS